MDTMTSNKPYLLRAFYEWIVDNNCTPYLLANIDVVGIDVPIEYAQNGQITLNISPTATGNLVIDSDAVIFNARFGGVPRQVVVPVKAVLALYAKENGAGTMFQPEDDAEGENLTSEDLEMTPQTERPSDSPVLEKVEAKDKKKGSHLKVIK